MQKTLVGFMRAETSEGVILVQRAYNCRFSEDAATDGDYVLELGKGGADALNLVVEIEKELAAGAASALFESSVSDSDTLKRVQFRNGGGVFVEPVGFAVSFYRLSSAI